MNSGIYKISSLINPDKFYIGRSIDFEKRFANHKYLLLKNKHHSLILQNHVNKYGIEDLLFDVVLLIDDVEEQILKEQEYIACNPFFNVSKSSIGGRGRNDQKITENNWHENLDEFFKEIESGSFYHLKLFFKLRFKKNKFNRNEVNEAFIKFGLT